MRKILLAALLIATVATSTVVIDRDAGAVQLFPIPLDITVGPPGSGPSATVDVPEEIFGLVCLITVRNNESAREGSNLVFTSGDTSVTLFNVESTAGRVTELLEFAPTASTLTVTIQRGIAPLSPGGGAYSGQDAVLVCPDVTPPTIPPIEPPPSESPPTTPSESPPVAPPAVRVPARFTG